MESEITCIICPIGCEVTVHHEEGTISKMEGHQCEKGIGYVKEELFDPRRTLTTTVNVKNGELPLVSVKTSSPVPRKRVFDVMDALSIVEVEAPVKIGDVLVENVLRLDADIVATKKVDREKD